MFAAESVPYHQTNAFTKITLDYLSGSENLMPFYAAPPTLDGIKETIEKKKKQPVNRTLLVEVLQQQYQSVPLSGAVQKNLQLLLSENTFTVCTAHQPNLFTGPLYFVYKVLHAIKLAYWLKAELSQYDFIPVYYMGSEDADFAELNHTYVNGKKIEWKKQQKGAVGRMLVDKTLLQLIDELEGQLSFESHGSEVIDLLRKCYAVGKDIQTATFELVNELYGSYGLIVLIPDSAALKKEMKQIFEDDLFRNIPSEIAQKTSERLAEHYNAQAYPREINLFYLKEDIRERIVFEGSRFSVLNTDINFSEQELKDELQNHPERFSPNVILRGLFQEMILPNLVFIGGGGEMAYWLQLRNLFNHYNIVYPVLVLRNSFIIVDEKQEELIKKLGLSTSEIFMNELEIANLLLEKEGKKPHLNGELNQLQSIYENLKTAATAVDVTLKQHVDALKTKAVQQLENLEKKMLRAERKKNEATQRQIAKLKEQLFPNKGLQERVENFSGFYAKWGRAFIDELYKNSFALEQKFTVLYQTH